MKTKHILTIGIGSLIITIIIIVGTWFKVEHLDEGSYLTTETRTPDAAFRLQTTGEDLRVYIFQVTEIPGIKCIFVAGTNKGDTFCSYPFNKLEK